MNIFSWFKKKKWSIPETTLPFCRYGYPPENLTWDMATKLGTGIIPMTTNNLPEICFQCKKKLIRLDHDWWKIEDGGQFMVTTAHCPDGHGWACDFA